MLALCKTTVDGTSPTQLRAGLAAIEGVRNIQIHEARAEVALSMLLTALYEGRPAIACVDDWEHWIAVVGVLGFGKRVVCVDSGDNDLVVVRTLDAFVDWWRGPGKKAFYAVVL